MFSVNAGSKEQRRESIRHAANPVFMGSTVRANDRFAIKAIISKHPAKFRSVLEIYGDDMVVQIIASLLDNGTFAKTNPRLESTQTHQPSEVRDRQHDALEQKAAQSETKALDEALRSDLALHEGNEGGEQIDVTGYNFYHTIIADPANMYGKKPDRSKTLTDPFHPIHHLCFPHT